MSPFMTSKRITIAIGFLLLTLLALCLLTFGSYFYYRYFYHDPNSYGGYDSAIVK